MRTQCASAIQNGLKYLAASQTTAGGFVTYCWSTDNPAPPQPVDATFTVSQVLYSLSFCAESASARATRERAAAHLLAEQEPPGVWHYYGKSSPNVISPDVDDTAIAWAALKRTGHPIAAGVLEALRASRNDAGLFNTWIGHPSTWVGIDSRDVDAVVNLNALVLFGLAGETIDPVCKYVITRVENDEFRRGSIYYSSPLAFTHAFSRAYADGGVRCLRDGVPKIRAATLSLQKPDGGWGNDLETALGALTLLNLGYRGEALDRSIHAILARQSPDGGWALATAYRGAVLPLHYGSRSLTTAVCLEVLAKYSK